MGKRVKLAVHRDDEVGAGMATDLALRYRHITSVEMSGLSDTILEAFATNCPQLQVKVHAVYLSLVHSCCCAVGCML
jgi:hypothetical protein